MKDGAKGKGNDKQVKLGGRVYAISKLLSHPTNN